MFPSKSMDYVGETSRFFPTIRIDGATTPNTYTSPFQSRPANRWSSSTDSTSPESYFNTPLPISQPLEFHNQQISTRAFDNSQLIYESQSLVYNSPSNIFESSTSHNDNYLPSFDRDLPHRQTQINNTPLQASRRPIVGRKILGPQSSSLVNESSKFSDLDSNIWPPTDPQTSNAVPTQYELFPAQDRSFESQPARDRSFDFQSPMKKCTEYPPDGILRSSSPTPSNMSSLTIYSQNMPPWPNMIQHPLSNFTTPYKPASYTGASSHDEIGPSKMCMFCRKNGETPRIYMDHNVKEKIGNKYRVTCPILRALVCMSCGATGDNAHTITYCPVLRNGNNGKPLQSTTITLKNTPIKSNGRRRF